MADASHLYMYRPEPGITSQSTDGHVQLDLFCIDEDVSLVLMSVRSLTQYFIATWVPQSPSSDCYLVIRCVKGNVDCTKNMTKCENTKFFFIAGVSS